MGLARHLLMGAVLCVGCAAPPPVPSGPDDSLPAPLAGQEQSLGVQTMPGQPPATWPVAIAEGAGRFVLPWRDTSGLHARVIDAGGERDFALGAGEWIGAAALGDRFAVVVGTSGGMILHVLDGASDDARTLELPGRAVPAVASDGARVLMVTTDGNGKTSGRPWVHALVADGAGVTRVELGALSPSPSLFGDPDGFIVDQHLLVSAGGAVERAPSEAVPGARVFHRHDPGGDAITLDGGRWLPLGAKVLSATRDTAGLDILVPDGADGQSLLHVSPDLTSAGATVAVPRSPSVPGWLRALRADRALWEAVVGSDHVFASLDRASLAPTGTFLRVAAPQSRTVSIAFDGRNLLLAWIAADGRYVYARSVLY